MQKSKSNTGQNRTENRKTAKTKKKTQSTDIHTHLRARFGEPVLHEALVDHRSPDVEHHSRLQAVLRQLNEEQQSSANRAVGTITSLPVSTI